MIPRATYRLQLHRDFPFAAASEVVPYLARLGISHVYASPILTARAGSRHCYDVIDHSKINPELGGEEGLLGFCAKLRQFDLKLIVDIVPNHMAADAGNAWWIDVLENGRSSEFACFFDIDWDSRDPLTDGKVLAPFLDAPCREILREGNISFGFDEKLGKLAFFYYQHRFPLRGEDYAQFGGRADPDTSLVAAANTPDSLRRLLARQHYRLCWWRTAADAINWRRFFDNNDLIGLRVEHASVFEAVHAKIFSLVAAGLIDGVRIDHVDGLADPARYCERMRARLDQLAPCRPYVVTEKILGKDEALPADWRVDGTTGYDFMNEVSALQHDCRGNEPLQCLWHSTSARSRDFETEERAARHEVLTMRFGAPLSATAEAFARLRANSEFAADLTLPSIRRALRLLIGEMRTYRTYATGRVSHSNADLEAAVAAAEAQSSSCDRLALHFIRDVVRGDCACEVAADAVRRFNQLAASVAAKSVEDMAFYRHGVLLSRNEVGSPGGEFSLSAHTFHARVATRAVQFPHSMTATATHDHKRGEDARARLAVLSEIADEWAAEVTGWFRLNEPLRGSILQMGDEYQLYQSLVGAWPLELDLRDGDALFCLSERMQRWRIKSLREAGLRTSWTDPDLDYETQSARFVRDILDRAQSSAFLSRLQAFAARIAPAGALNGLAQATLRCLVPGVPDTFQGTEFWDFSLVDPDNRRSVDFSTRSTALEQGVPAVQLLESWPDGRVKQEVLRSLLQLRTALPALFEEGDYVPLEVAGARADNVLAFARRHDRRKVVVAVPRLCASVCMNSRSPLPAAAFWSDTDICIPHDLSAARWRSMFDNAFDVSASPRMRCALLFARFPVAVLVPNG